MSEMVRLHGMAYGGAAVGRLADGAAVFVAGGLRGEVVEVQVAERKKSFARAQLLRVVEPAPERVAPPCPHFRAGCGGCQWQFGEYGAQLLYKEDVLRDQLSRLGGLRDVPLLPSLAAPEAWGYRNVVEFHVGPEGIGFHREGTHAIVDVQSCPLAEPGINAALAAVRTSRKRLAGTASVQVRTGADALHLTLVTDDDPRGYKLLATELADRLGAGARVTGVANGTPRMRGLTGDPWVWMNLAGHRFRASALSFFQVNSAVAGQLVEHLLPAVSLGSRVLDLYCGVGTFSLLAAERAAEVVGVENSASALADAATNAAEFAANNLRLVQADVGASQALAAEPWDLAILDPPRSGCPGSVLEVLNAARLAYVSCDPTTLARDLRLLTQRGYQLDSMRLFDMFPQTYHMETLSLLSR
ncbi:MAG: class I SAM-dependent RNA methyltransferase [Chloroflexota bacterium]